VTTREKLVRDGIPERMRARGVTPRFRVASREELKTLLLRKLREEAAEFEADPVYEELADVMEVLQAIIQAHDVCPRELEATRLKKRAEVGGFEGGVVLEIDGLYEGEGSPARRQAKRAAVELSGYVADPWCDLPLAACRALVTATLRLLDEDPVALAAMEIEAADRAIAAAADDLARARQEGCVSGNHGDRLAKAREHRDVLARAFARVGLL
jgi:predicted house-cleaning noncanonical NTP pyrophosphatase (MazG superfamily)